MIDRRRLLLTVGASGFGLAACATAPDAAPVPAVGSAPAPTSPPVPPSAAAHQAGALYERMWAASLRNSPTSVTSLGLDRQPEYAWAKRELGDPSPAEVARQADENRAFLRELDALPRAELTGMDAVDYDAVRFGLAIGIEGYDRFKYGVPGFAQAYVLNQLNSSLTNTPDFLDAQHGIDTREDADAYLSRLSQYPAQIDAETERGLSDAARGAAPPDFVLDKALVQLRAARIVPAAKSSLVASIARRTQEKGIAGDWATLATRLVETAVYPAYDRQIAAMERLRTTATHDAGVWRLPDGEAYYRFGVRQWVTVDMDGEEIHRLGVAQVAEISARIDGLLKARGLTRGTVGERLGALGKDPRRLYPNTEAGKARLIADLNAQIEAVTARLPAYFGTLPKTGVEVRRVPAAIEAGAPGGYAQTGTLDGSRPGAYYINLRDTAEWPSWTLPTLTYHEATPGHVFQGSLALEAQGVPMIRKTGFYSGYLEGWGLYAEQLADEMGLYERDPLGRIGYLQSMLLRAVRLVVDSGLHHTRWSREQAIRYMVDTLGDQESSVTTEVERYCVWPGQACSYKIGQLKWVEVREKATAALGARFDIRAFHDAALVPGAMPLAVLERRIEDWIAAQP